MGLPWDFHGDGARMGLPWQHSASMGTSMVLCMEPSMGISVVLPRCFHGDSIFFYFLHPIYYPRLTLSLPSSSNIGPEPLILCLPSDNVQHELQRWSLISIPERRRNRGNKTKPMHKV